MVNAIYKLNNNDFVVASLKPKESYRTVWINLGKNIDKNFINGKIVLDNYSTLELKNHKDYPKQTNEHNALADAKWNKKLHEFIINKI